MSAPPLITTRTLLLLNRIHENELARARRSPFMRLLMMRGYAKLLARAGLPVRPWWGR